MPGSWQVERIEGRAVDALVKPGARQAFLPPLLLRVEVAVLARRRVTDPGRRNAVDDDAILLQRHGVAGDRDHSLDEQGVGRGRGRKDDGLAAARCPLRGVVGHDVAIAEPRHHAVRAHVQPLTAGVATHDEGDDRPTDQERGEPTVEPESSSVHDSSRKCTAG